MLFAILRGVLSTIGSQLRPSAPVLSSPLMWKKVGVNSESGKICAPCSLRLMWRVLLWFKFWWLVWFLIWYPQMIWPKCLHASTTARSSCSVTVYLSCALFNFSEKVQMTLSSWVRMAPIAYVLLALGYTSNGHFGLGYLSMIASDMNALTLLNASCCFPPRKIDVHTCEPCHWLANVRSFWDVSLDKINYPGEITNLFDIFRCIDV